MKVYKTISILLFLIVSFFYNTSSASPHEYEATYTFHKSGISFAESKHKMMYIEEDNHWCISTESRSIGIFSLKKDEREENSCFRFESKNESDTSQTNIFLTTIEYVYKRFKSGYSSVIETKKIDNNLYTYLNQKKIKHSENILIDRLVAQIFGYSLSKIKVSDKGRERLYTFSLIGYENLDTVIGNLKTIIIKKEIEGSKRTTITWYSSDTNFLPVKIEQYRLDELKFTAILERLSN